MDALETDAIAVLDLDLVERWNVYQRLQELAINCHCGYGQPLQVNVKTATDVIQIWSVVQRSTLSRRDAIERLNRCWRQVSYR